MVAAEKHKIMKEGIKMKMKKCKACGAEIAKSAKICPHCGAKNGSKLGVIVAVVVVVFILLIAFSGGSDSGPKKVGEADTNSFVDSNERTSFVVGDKVEYGKVFVTFLDCQTNNGSTYNRPQDGYEYLTCEFEIENNTGSELTISSLLCFDSYVDDYSVNINVGALLEVENQLDGTIADGKKMRGSIGYEVPVGWETFEIVFTPDFWSGKEFIFTAKNE